MGIKVIHEPEAKQLIKKAKNIKFEKDPDDGGILVSFTVRYPPNRERKYYGYVTTVFREIEDLG